MNTGADDDAASPGVEEVLAILSRPDDDDLQELVALAAAICDSQFAGISVRLGEDYHMPVVAGFEPVVCPSEDTFCAHTMGTDDVFVIEDAAADPRVRDIAWVDGRLASTRFYASAPVYAPAGQMVGRLCVIDLDPKTLSGLQRRALQALAVSITQVVELRLLLDGRPAPAATRVSEAAATVMSQLAAELSHDLRVPLTSVLASVEMLEEELSEHPDRTVGVLLGRTTRAAHRMLRMLDQNLQLGRSGIAPVSQDVDLEHLVRQLVLDFGPLLDAAGATVEVEPLPVVRGDPDDFYSVMQNLLTNAVKFARPDVPPRVVVTSRRGSDRWRISVHDNGMGIPEDRLADVFSLFSRVDTDIAGHGIGLATVARIVASHGGRTGAERGPGGGTEIWFELPDAPPPDGTTS